MTKTKTTKQYECAEDFSYAKAHDLQPDPGYYLEKQFKNALEQILETVETGISKKLFDDAFARHEMRTSRQMSLRQSLNLEEMTDEIVLDGKRRIPKKQRNGQREKKPKMTAVTKEGLSAFFGMKRT